MILGSLTVACCNIANVNITMAVGERKIAIIFIFLLFYNMSKQFLAPRGLSAECVQVSVM